ncbi:MAG: amidohydrolase [Roseateles depolymerans]|uniref:5-methylthioadenosine/S-adenosylhomocysteine deaminase n=1 Tax=Roseateles depolymerans TaxID=76731 RepID=A0A2W5D6G5_9BURK|nr:MAG: amidohydrolase [Roseateles depolymerans]
MPFRKLFDGLAALLPAALLGWAPLTATAAQVKVDTLIDDGIVVTMDAERRVIQHGSVAIDGARIVAVGEAAELRSRYRARQVLAAKGRLVIPGLINGHSHVPMTLFRGLADDLEVSEWLTRWIFPAEARNVDEGFVRAGTRLGLAEMIRGGTTTFCDMYYFEDAIADETARAGLRGVLGETVLEFPAPDNKTWDAALAYTGRFVKRWQGHPLIVPAIAPHAPYTVTAAHLQQVQAWSEEMKVPVLMHVAETEFPVPPVVGRTTARGDVAYLDGLGALKRNLIAAHVVALDGDEIRLLAERGVGVAHNPTSNMKTAAGLSPVPQMQAAGVAVGLGTDGAASNNDLDLWEEMNLAALLHKHATHSARTLSAEQAFAMGTIEGARALHLEQEIGSLEAGKRADLVIVDIDALHSWPGDQGSPAVEANAIYSQLVYATKASDVRTVLVDGRVLMRDRRLLTLDEAAIKRDALAYRQKIRASLARP